MACPRTHSLDLELHSMTVVNDFPRCRQYIRHQPYAINLGKLSTTNIQHYLGLTHPLTYRFTTSTVSIHQHNTARTVHLPSHSSLKESNQQQRQQPNARPTPLSYGLPRHRIRARYLHLQARCATSWCAAWSDVYSST